MTSSQIPAPLHWHADILRGFEQTTLTALPAADGPVELVLVRRRAQQGHRAVLYIHGFIDYFFQTHLADFYNAQGLHFYALELRRHGRALRSHQLPNYTKDIDEFLADVDTAITALRTCEDVRWLLLNGHSTGGLVAALYAHRGSQRARVDAVFLNSPFLDMNVPAWQARYAEPLVAWLGKWLPRIRLPDLSPVYAQSIHAAHHGEWHFDERWKPIAGFPIYSGWFRAIHLAHAEVTRGLQIGCPCLVLHAARSAQPRQWSEVAMSADTVLSVADIARLAPGLGTKVEVHAIPGGLHDLVLSPLPARELVWQRLGDWLARLAAITA